MYRHAALAPNRILSNKYSRGGLRPRPECPTKGDTKGTRRFQYPIGIFAVYPPRVDTRDVRQLKNFTFSEQLGKNGIRTRGIG